MSSSPPLRLPLLVAALGAAAAGQLALTGPAAPAFGPAAVALLASIVLGALAARGEPALEAPRPRLLHPGARAGLACAAALAILGNLVEHTGRHAAAGILWAISVSVFLFAVRPPLPSERTRAPAAALAALTGIAFALRYAALTRLPSNLDADLASIGLDALRIGSDPALPVVGVAWAQISGLYFATFKATMSIFGANAHGLMINGVLFGAATIPMVFLMTREAFGERAGLIAAGLLAVSPTHVHFSRVFASASAVFVVTALVFALLRAVRTSEPFWYALAGIASAACLLVYFSARVGLVVAAALGAAVLAFERGALRARLRGAGLFLLGLGIGYGPMTGYTLGHPSSLLGRSGTMLWAHGSLEHAKASYATSSVVEVLAQQARRSFLAAHYGGDLHPHYFLPDPLVDPVTAALLVVAIGVSIRRARAPSRATLLVWVLATLVFGGVLTMDPPIFLHLAIALPAIVALVAGLLDELLETGTRRVAAALLGVVAASSLYAGLRYVRHASRHTTPSSTVVRWMSTFPPGTPVALHFPGVLWANDRAFSFFDRGLVVRDVTEEEIRNGLAPPFAAAIAANRLDLAEALAARYPDASREMIPSERGLDGRAVLVGVGHDPQSSTLGRTSLAGWLAGLLVAASPLLLSLFARSPARRFLYSQPRVATAPAVRRFRIPMNELRLAARTAASRLSSGRLAIAALAAVAATAVGVHVLADQARFGPVAGQAAGVALLLAGALTFGWAVPTPEGGALDPPADPDPSRVTFDRRSILGVVLPFASSAFAVMRFMTKGEDGLVVAAWAAGILGLLAGQWGTRARPAPSGQRPIHLALLLAILAVAVASRLYRLDTLPYNLDGDFASHGLQARELATAAHPKIFGFGWAVIPLIGFFPSALTMKVFGTGLVGLAMAGVLEGLLIIVCGYLLARDLYGPRAGVFTAALLTISYTLLHFSRTSEYIDPVFFTAWAVYFLVRAIRWGSGLAAAGAGVMSGFALLMYYAGRIVVVLAAGVVLVVLFRGLSWGRARVKEGLLFAVAMLMTLGPMIPVMLSAPGDVMTRTRQVNIFDNPDAMTHMKGVYQVKTPREVLVQQVRRAALLFFTYTDASTQFGCRRAFLDEASGTALVLGLGVVLVHRRRLGTALPLLWLGSILVLGCALTINAPFYPRLVGLAVPATLLGGLGLERVYSLGKDLLERQGPRAAALVPGAALALLLAATGLASWRWYLKDYGSYITGTARLGRYLAARPGFRARSVAVPDWWSINRDINMLAPGALIDDLDEAAVVKGEFDPAVPLVISPRKTEALAALHRRFPDGSFETIAGNAPGETAFVVFRTVRGG